MNTRKQTVKLWSCWVLAVAFTALSATVTAATLQATPKIVLVDGANAVLRVSVQHPAGASALKVVAAEVLGSDALVSFPTLYDDGSHGDATAGDGVYSLQVSLSGGAGERKVIYYVVDNGGVEVVTPPAPFTLE